MDILVEIHEWYNTLPTSAPSIDDSGDDDDDDDDDALI